MTITCHQYRRIRRTEDGTVLILALVVLLVAGLLGIAIGSFAVGAGANVTNIRSVGALDLNAESTGMVAIESVRTSYAFPTQTPATTTYYAANAASPTAETCMPSLPSTSFTVSCIGYQGTGDPAVSRIVDFYVCASSLIGGDPTKCSGLNSNVALFAEVTYDDIPPGQSPATEACSTVSSATCGMTMTIDKWDVRNADTS